MPINLIITSLKYVVPNEALKFNRTQALIKPLPATKIAHHNAISLNLLIERFRSLSDINPIEINPPTHSERAITWITNDPEARA